MADIGERLRGFLFPPSLPPDACHTYRCHLGFALLDAAAAGILSNAAFMALNGLGASDWHLGLQLPLSSLGMFASLFLGGWMARRRKLPFVVCPGLAFAVCSLAAAFAHGPFWFLVLLGLGSAFEVAVRPAIMAIVRLNYPATQRGHATGTIRTWCSLVFLTSILLSAYALQTAPGDARVGIHVQMIVAGLLSLVSFLVFGRIRVQEASPGSDGRVLPDLLGSVDEAWEIVRRDARYRRYLLGCFLFGFFGLMYVPYIAAFLKRDLGCGYWGGAMLLHVVPSLAAFALTGALGRWFDRTSVHRAWGWVRLGWGLDPLILAAAPLTMAVFPPAAFLAPCVARLSRGAVMGGSWVLWWRIGVHHFAPPGADTSRYMGILVFLNGVMRLGGPLVGICVLYGLSRQAVLVIGGVGVLLSAAHSFWQARREAREPRLATAASFEAQFASPHHPQADSPAPPRSGPSRTT